MYHKVWLAPQICYLYRPPARRQKKSAMTAHTRQAMTIEPKYSASFTAGALLYEEHRRLGALLGAPDFEARLRQEIEENAYLGIKAYSSRKRVASELRKRHAAAPPGFWSFYAQRSAAEQRLALFFLCLKAYPLMMDFHVEGALKQWRGLARRLEALDLQRRLDEIASMDEEVGSWTEATQRKTITVYLRTLAEAGLLKDGALVKPAAIAPDFWAYFAQLGEAWFSEACFHSR
jgi:hypothetical protein